MIAVRPHHHGRAALFAFTIAAAVLLTLVFAARVFQLDAQSFWNDEGNSIVQAARPLALMAENAARDIHPPGYYALLAGWRLLTGETEFAYRALSVFASVLAAAFAAGAAARLAALTGRARGLAALAALLTLAFTLANTFSIYYAQEARMYALHALWAAGLFRALTLLLARPVRRHALAVAVFTAAGLWTHYAFPFFMLAGGGVTLGVLCLRRAGRMRLFALYTAANMLALIAYAPWAAAAFRQITTWPNTGVAIAPGEALATIARWLTFGITGEGAVMAIPFLLMLFALIPAAHAGSRLPGSGWARWLAAAWVCVPLALFLLMGLFRPSNLKFLLPAQLGTAVWLALGVCALVGGGLARPRRMAWALPLAGAAAALWIVLTQAAGLEPLYRDARYARADYRAIVAEIAARLGRGDLVILNAPNQAEVFGYYSAQYDADDRDADRLFPAVLGLPPGLGGDDDETRALTLAALDAHAGGLLYAVLWGEAERDPRRIVETVLDMHAYSMGDRWFGDVRTAAYALEPRPPLPFSQAVGLRLAGDAAVLTLDAHTPIVREARPGDVVRVGLRWTGDAPITADLTVFAQLLRPDGTLAAQHDSAPAGGARPTSGWRAGEPVEDRRALRIPPDAAPGVYTLIVGAYPAGNPAARLLTDAGADVLTLATITVVPG